MRFDQHSVFSNRNKKTTHPYISFFFTNTTARLCQHTPHTPKQTTPKALRQPQTHSKPLGYMGRAPFNELAARGGGIITALGNGWRDGPFRKEDLAWDRPLLHRSPNTDEGGDGLLLSLGLDNNN